MVEYGEAIGRYRARAMCWAFAGAGLGFLAGHNLVFMMSVITLVFVLGVMLLGSLLTNSKRTRTIQYGTCVDATLDTYTTHISA